MVDIMGFELCDSEAGEEALDVFADGCSDRIAFLPLHSLVSLEGARRQVWDPKPLLVDRRRHGRMFVGRLSG
jgi:hypothetical protein